MSTVLVVDDEPDIRQLLKLTFATAGYRVLEAAEGREALDLLERDDVDVVLLDLMMPVMDGWALLWTLKDRGAAPPVIVMSARPELSADGRHPMGAIAYLQKPFPLDAALGSVNDALAKAS